MDADDFFGVVDNCPEQALEVAHVTGPLGGLAAGTATIAGAVATAEEPPVAMEVLSKAGDAYAVGYGVGAPLGAVVDYAGCETAREVDSLYHEAVSHFSEPHLDPPAWSPDMASSVDSHTLGDTSQTIDPFLPVFDSHQPDSSIALAEPLAATDAPVASWFETAPTASDTADHATNSSWFESTPAVLDTADTHSSSWLDSQVAPPDAVLVMVEDAPQATFAVFDSTPAVSDVADHSTGSSWFESAPSIVDNPDSHSGSVSWFESPTTSPDLVAVMDAPAPSPSWFDAAPSVSDNADHASTSSWFDSAPVVSDTSDTHSVSSWLDAPAASSDSSVPTSSFFDSTPSVTDVADSHSTGSSWFDSSPSTSDSSSSHSSFFDSSPSDTSFADSSSHSSFDSFGSSSHDSGSSSHDSGTSSSFGGDGAV